MQKAMAMAMAMAGNSFPPLSIHHTSSPNILRHAHFFPP